MTQQLLKLIQQEAPKFNFEWEVCAAFVEVESSGVGFDSKTKKIIIQFEPSHFKSRATTEYKYYTELKKKKELTQLEKDYIADWDLVLANKVSKQSLEWEAFNKAFKINPDAAMLATSIGMGQVMGFNHARLGYKTVGEMWDDAKKGEARQIWQMLKFLDSDTRLKKAVKEKNWHLIATYYNGVGYQKLAQKLGREPYNISMEKAYNKFKKQ